MDGSIRTMLFCAVLAMVEALQVFVIVAHVYSFIPIHWNVPIPKGLEPERESFLYCLFLGLACAAMVINLIFVRPRFEQSSNQSAWMRYLFMECAWVFVWFFVFFKWVTYGHLFYNVLPYEKSKWLMPFFYGMQVINFGSKIFWNELKGGYAQVKPVLARIVSLVTQQSYLYCCAAFLLSILLLPKVEDVVALGYSWDQFNHWDSFFLTRALIQAGFDYAGVVWILFGMTIAGWTFLFWALHRWLGSAALAAAGVLLGIKLNLFHYGMAPVAWIYPDSLFLHQGLDRLISLGLDNVPMFDALRVRQFFSFFMGYGIPVFYVLTLLVFAHQSKIVLGLCVAGLVSYVQYIAQPKLFAYGALAMPAVFLLCFWIKNITSGYWKGKALHVHAGFALLCVAALLTNRVYVSYPHAFAVYGQDYQEQRQLLKQSFDLSTDVQLMQSLTSINERVAVIGSFELALLNQAGRKAFFHEAPVLRSSILQSTNINGLRLDTRKEVLAVMEELTESLPDFIFLEAKLLTLPKEVYQEPTGFATLLSTVAQHYQPFKQGRYFVAWRKKEAGP